MWSYTVGFNIVARLLGRRIERKIEYVHVEDHFGFRGAKETSNLVGKLGIISEGTLDVDEGLYVSFIDGQKEFVLVNRTKFGRSCYRPGVAQRVPGSQGSQIS
jgi:hypothetical protein